MRSDAQGARPEQDLIRTLEALQAMQLRATGEGCVAAAECYRGAIEALLRTERDAIRRVQEALW